MKAKCIFSAALLAAMVGTANAEPAPKAALSADELVVQPTGRVPVGHARFYYGSGRLEITQAPTMAGGGAAIGDRGVPITTWRSDDASGFYTNFSASTSGGPTREFVDDGQLDRTNGGCSASTIVEEFVFEYFTTNVEDFTFDYTVVFYNGNPLADGCVAGAPTATIATTTNPLVPDAAFLFDSNLPGITSNGGAPAAWIVTVDLTDDPATPEVDEDARVILDDATGLWGYGFNYAFEAATTNLGPIITLPNDCDGIARPFFSVFCFQPLSGGACVATTTALCASAPGFIPNAAGSGLRAFGLPSGPAGQFYFEIRGAEDCTNSDCGRCCAVDGTCTVSTSVACATAGGTFTADSGCECLNDDCLGAPANDDCADAVAVVGFVDGVIIPPVAYDSRGASQDGPNNATGDCGTNAAGPGRDTWFTWTAPCTGSVRFSLCEASGGEDSTIAVHSGGCGVLAEVGCDDDGCGAVGGASVVTFGATGGTAYLLRIGTWTGTCGAQGGFIIQLVDGSGNPIDCPANPCPADIAGGGNGMTDVPDIFAFLALWFSGTAGGDPYTNCAGAVSVGVPAIFAFLADWFAGCPCP